MNQRIFHATLCRISLLICILISPALAAASAVDTATGVFSPAIASLQLRVDGSPFAVPVATLDNQQGISLHFDLLNPDGERLRYHLVPCSAEWIPEGLVDSEWTDSFNDAPVPDPVWSETPALPYSHFSFDPLEAIPVNISGNYLVRVTPDSAPDSILLQARIMVADGSAKIDGSVSSRTDIDFNRARQQLTLSVDPAGLDRRVNPMDLITIVSQNERPDLARRLPSPTRIEGRSLIYDHLPQLVFMSGNEYRRFDAVNLTTPGLHVESLGYEYPFHVFNLAVDQPREDTMYVYDLTRRGRFIVRDDSSADSDVEAEYVLVRFTLEMPRLYGARVYVEGDFTSRRFSPACEMTYNPDSRAYELTMMLKQGAYDYQYLAVEDGASQGITRLIEGDYYNTSNAYDVAVYYRIPSERHDRLAAFSLIFSNGQQQ
ncbi:MAG: DUF5103 domain-containing protein [Muribaculaceae bacterium]|nr:DUF5103 domain-containing protein [Muribaculaceae bacterium]